VVQQVALGPRITGTEPHRQLGDQILAELAANGWTTQTQDFSYQGTPARNLIGVKGAGNEIVILGAHYDTRRRADQDAQQPDQPVPGANDGASGVAVLLELARALDVQKSGKQVWLVFFDAEDNGELDGWDWIAGSRHFADNMTITPSAVVIVDMVGDQQQDLFLERNSTQELAQQIWDVAQQLGYGEQFKPQGRWSMIDDHTPFLERGLRAVDIIDFDYPHWHTTQDTPDKVSANSLERVGRTLQVWLEGEP
jgi:Zn-dependent M28 family amino/carboxypeptidase